MTVILGFTQSFGVHIIVLVTINPCLYHLSQITEFVFVGLLPFNKKELEKREIIISLWCGLFEKEVLFRPGNVKINNI